MYTPLFQSLATIGTESYLNISRNSLIPTLGGCERCSGCSSSEVVRRMLLLWAVSWNHTYPWHLCNGWIRNGRILFRTSNQCADVAVSYRGALWILWIEFPLGNKYLMHWDQRIGTFFWCHTAAKCKYKIQIQRPGAKLFAICHHLEITFSFCAGAGRIWKPNVANSHKTSTCE